jgi:hypothetical protein
MIGKKVNPLLPKIHSTNQLEDLRHTNIEITPDLHPLDEVDIFKLKSPKTG